MRTAPAAITAARQASSSRLAKIWRIERTDGVILRFTEHDRDLVVDGETFLATASFDPSSIKVNADLSVSDMDVQGAFDSSYITAEDVLAGRYNAAAFWVAECLWDDTAEGKDVLKFGWIGRVKEAGGKFVAELLDPSSQLQHNIVSAYSASCRATLGDARCGVNLASWTLGGEVEGGGTSVDTPTVGTVNSRKSFTALYLPAQDADYWKAGKLTWLTGANAGLSMDVYDCDGTTVELMLSMPFEVASGDSFTLTAGCDKALATCRDKFGNVLRFRGEPHVPVTDDMIKGPVRDGISTTPTTGGGTGGGNVPVEPPAEPDPDTVTLSGSPSMSA